MSSAIFANKSSTESKETNESAYDEEAALDNDAVSFASSESTTKCMHTASGLLYASTEFQGFASNRPSQVVALSTYRPQLKSLKSRAFDMGRAGFLLYGAPSEFQGAAPEIIPPPFFLSTPLPPKGLWDTDDVQFLEKVACDVNIKLTHIDPKNGQFKGMMKFNWLFRVLNFPDRTEPRVRVPGIRMPGLACQIVESRIWRNFKEDSDKTIAWSGTTVLTFQGYEMFEVYDFPYDRQVIDLDLFEFVWRTEKDSDCFHEAMKIVSFTSRTRSMLPEWDCWPALIDPRDIKQLGSGPCYATRFIVKLRLQRKAQFYIFQIFFIAFLITCCSLFPLALTPGKLYIGDRLNLSVSGLLTLVGFKSGVADSLPSVPYRTVASTFLQCQIFTVVFSAFESIASYELVEIFKVMDIDVVDKLEDGLLCFLLLAWMIYFIYVAFCMDRTSWEDVVRSQCNQREIVENAKRKQQEVSMLDRISLSREPSDTSRQRQHFQTKKKKAHLSTCLTRRQVATAQDGMGTISEGTATASTKLQGFASANHGLISL